MKFTSLLALLGLVSASEIQNLNEVHYWPKYHNGRSSQNQLNKLGGGLEDMMNYTQMQIQNDGAHIFKPLLDAVNTIHQDHKMSANCNSANFFSCFARKPEENLLQGTCAQAFNCVSEQEVGLKGQNVMQRLQKETYIAMQSYDNSVKYHSQAFADQAEKVLVELYGCDRSCVQWFVQNLDFSPSQANSKCGCSTQITADMSTQLFHRSPDMELFNLMTVNESEYTNDQIILDQMKNDIMLMPVFKKPTEKTGEEGKENNEGDSGATPWIVGVVAVAVIAIGGGIYIVYNRKKNQEAGDEHAHEGGAYLL